MKAIIRHCLTLVSLLCTALPFVLSGKPLGPPLPPEFPNHPSDHSHPENATFIYQDLYSRIDEGETVELCARLNQPVDTEFEVEYYTDSEYTNAEKYEDYIYTSGKLTFQPGSTKECFNLSTIDDNNAAEENLEALNVYWTTTKEDVYFYNTLNDDEALSVVTIEDNDVLTLRPNATSVTVNEGDYTLICVTSDQTVDDYDALFYVAFDDKHYSADIYHDLQYTHIHDYPDFYYYGGVYDIAPDENQTCFHFHTKDDDKFEANENFAIRLLSFKPFPIRRRDDIVSSGVGSGSGDPYQQRHVPFQFNGDKPASYHGHHYHDCDHHDHDHDHHHHDHDHHDHHYDYCNDPDKYDYYDEFYELYADLYSEYYFPDTHIPAAFSTIHVTIVDNDEPPCLTENTPPCTRVIEDIFCLHLQKEAKGKKDVPKSCRYYRGEDGLLGSFLRRNQQQST